MALKRQKVPVHQLQVGMYVSDLDRPWLETPFKLQGLMIKNSEQITELKAWCQFVYIDTEKCDDKSPAIKHFVNRINAQATSPKPVAPATYTFTRYQRLAPVKRPQASFYEQAKKVTRLHQGLEHSLAEAAHSIKQGKAFDASKLVTASKDICTSLHENPDALTWLTGVKRLDDYLYQHSIRTAVWSGLFCQEIGMPIKDQALIIQAALLKEVGKTVLPESLIQKPLSQMSADERRKFQKSSLLAGALLKQVKGIHPRIIKMVESQGEYYDGSGSPAKLCGDQIPFGGIAVGISASFDRLLHPQFNDEACTVSQAVSQLRSVKNIHYQEDVVDDFIAAIGLYPSGTVVELTGGYLAVVIEQQVSRLRPKVSLITDKNQRVLAQFKTVDLTKAAENNIQVVREVEKAPWLAEISQLNEQMFAVKSKRFGGFL